MPRRNNLLEVGKFWFDGISCHGCVTHRADRSFQLRLRQNYRFPQARMADRLPKNILRSERTTALRNDLPEKQQVLVGDIDAPVHHALPARHNRGRPFLPPPPPSPPAEARLAEPDEEPETPSLSPALSSRGRSGRSLNSCSLHAPLGMALDLGIRNR